VIVPALDTPSPVGVAWLVAAGPVAAEASVAEASIEVASIEVASIEVAMAATTWRWPAWPGVVPFIMNSLINRGGRGAVNWLFSGGSARATVGCIARRCCPQRTFPRKRFGADLSEVVPRFSP
jgi:hypothetical protein